MLPLSETMSSYCRFRSFLIFCSVFPIAFSSLNVGMIIESMLPIQLLEIHQRPAADAGEEERKASTHAPPTSTVTTTKTPHAATPMKTPTLPHRTVPSTPT